MPKHVILICCSRLFFGQGHTLFTGNLKSIGEAPRWIQTLPSSSLASCVKQHLRQQPTSLHIAAIDASTPHLRSLLLRRHQQDLLSYIRNWNHLLISQGTGTPRFVQVEIRWNFPVAPRQRRCVLQQKMRNEMQSWSNSYTTQAQKQENAVDSAPALSIKKHTTNLQPGSSGPCNTILLSCNRLTRMIQCLGNLRTLAFV